MKKFMGFLMITILMVTAFTSCKKDDGGGDSTAQASLIKTISFDADWNGGVSGYEFFYDVNKKVTNFDRTFDAAPDGAFVYDYSVSGKLTVTKDAVTYATYDINAQGYITKEDWGGGEYASYEYNADGYLTKGYEYWGGLNRLKYEIVITAGNIMKITTYDDDGTTVKKIKEFTYTIGNNVNDIHQANVVDSDWKPVGFFYGKASAKLVDFFEYWDPRNLPISKSKSTMTYTFDTKNRPATVTKTLADLSTEVWGYTYYENE
jgi:hypothetical protein